MKIIKDTKTSLLIKSFLLNNKDYLSVSALYYFDFNNPEEVLEEQLMWQESMEQLGSNILDLGMPKPNAEVLLSGCCYTQAEDDGTSHVKLKVGSIDKELYVFGDRFYKNGLISRAQSFVKMPLIYEKAFGGKNYAKNPLGKGYGDSDALPNIEDPKHLIVTNNEKNNPSGFMPYDISWPQCADKLGTYDEQYKKELWPGFAADMDYTYFNRAPADQQLDGFFKGAQSIELINMHPKEQHIISHIPELSVRCFATSKEENEEGRFQEIPMQRDTLWLFPELQRGIIIFRGTIEIEDEEYTNLKYLNLKPLKVDETPKSLDEHYELQKKELKRGAEIDQAPMQEAQGKIKEAKQKIFDIPRELKESELQHAGKRPTLKQTPAQKLDRMHNQIDDAIDKMDASKEKLQVLKDKFSHYIKIDVNAFDGAKEKLLVSKDKVSSMINNVENSLADTDEIKLEALQKIKDIKNNPKLPDEAKEFEADTSFLEPKVKEWSDWAFEFLSDSVKSLQKEPEVLHKLRHLGLAKRTIKRSWIGFNSSEVSVMASEWMLDSDDMINLPRGLVVARFKEAKLISLRIIDIDKLIDPNPLHVKGSDEDFDNLLCYEDENLPLFYLKDDLEAWLCDQECYDICNTLVCDDISCVGDKADELLEKAPVIFYLQEDGVVEKLTNALKFDTKEYSNLFELHQNGIEIREQILENLPTIISEQFPKERDVSVKSINKKSKKIADEVRDKLKVKGDAVKDELMAKKDKAMLEVKESIAKINVKLKAQGLDTIELPKETPCVASKGFISESEVAKGFDDAISKLQLHNVANNLHVDDKILEIQKAKEQTLAMVAKGNQQYKNAQIKFADAKVKLADPIPDWAKKMMNKAGIDPADPHKKFTRELVIEYHADGRSLAGKNLSKLDLSQLDLRGIDLQGANILESDFTATNLSGANLKKAIAKKADFTDATLDDGDISNAIFQESIVKRISAKNIKAHRTLFKKVEIQESDFEGSDLEGIVFKDASLQVSNFSSCSFIGAPFLSSIVLNSVFDNSKMDKVVFSESNISESGFTGIDSEAILFNNSIVTNSDFSCSKLYNMRILKESSFENCNLRDSKMNSSTIFESSLKRCNLQRGLCNRMMIKTSNILECDFRAVKAEDSRFEFSNFAHCNLAGLDLLNGSFRRTFLQNCNLDYANLYSVEFYKIKLHETSFKGANLKRSGLQNRLELVDE
ncbi:MAG: DUF2169 domain-containing protein [Campylobacterota bacterium]|nr:DUF2169 domain-containing protein [Campylobacterota bacterium]